MVYKIAGIIIAIIIFFGIVIPKVFNFLNVWIAFGVAIIGIFVLYRIINKYFKNLIK